MDFLQDISIHTFLAEGDEYRLDKIASSTISIHTFLAEGDAVGTKSACDFAISIHTFLAEGDYLHAMRLPLRPNFNPHLPCGR